MIAMSPEHLVTVNFRLLKKQTFGLCAIALDSPPVPYTQYIYQVNLTTPGQTKQVTF